MFGSATVLLSALFHILPSPHRSKAAQNGTTWNCHKEEWDDKGGRNKNKCRGTAPWERRNVGRELIGGSKELRKGKRRHERAKKEGNTRSKRVSVTRFSDKICILKCFDETWKGICSLLLPKLEFSFCRPHFKILSVPFFFLIFYLFNFFFPRHLAPSVLCLHCSVWKLIALLESIILLITLAAGYHVFDFLEFEMRDVFGSSHGLQACKGHHCLLLITPILLTNWSCFQWLIPAMYALSVLFLPGVEVTQGVNAAWTAPWNLQGRKKKTNVQVSAGGLSTNKSFSICPRLQSQQQSTWHKFRNILSFQFKTLLPFSSMPGKQAKSHHKCCIYFGNRETNRVLCTRLGVSVLLVVDKHIIKLPKLYQFGVSPPTAFSPFLQKITIKKGTVDMI